MKPNRIIMMHIKKATIQRILLLLACGGFFLAFFIMKVDVSVDTHGFLQVKNKNIIIEHPDGGKVAKLYVCEGQRVKKGELLASIDNSYISEEFNKLENLKASLKIRAERLIAEINGSSFDIENANDTYARQIYSQEYSYFLADKKNIQNDLNVSESVQEQKKTELRANDVRISGLSQEVAYDEKQVNLVQNLVKSGAAAEGTLLGKKLELQKSINDYNNALSERDIIKAQLEKAQLDTSKIQENYIVNKQNELLKVKDQLSDVEGKLKGASIRKKQEEIYSPVNGELQKLTKSHEGSVIAPGGELFEIAPSDIPVIASVRLDTKDRNKIWTGMEAKIDISGLNKTFGSGLKGRVGIISADSLTDERAGRYYQVEIILNKGEFDKEIFPGMAVNAYIKTGQRTIAEYIFRPLIQGVSHSFSEV